MCRKPRCSVGRDMRVAVGGIGQTADGGRREMQEIMFACGRPPGPGHPALHPSITFSTPVPRPSPSFHFSCHPSESPSRHPTGHARCHPDCLTSCHLPPAVTAAMASVFNFPSYGSERAPQDHDLSFQYYDVPAPGTKPSTHGISVSRAGRIFTSASCIPFPYKF